MNLNRIKFWLILSIFVGLFVVELFPQKSILPKPDKLKVLKTGGGDVFISYKYLDNTDMHLVLGKCGVNNIVNIKAIYLDTNYTDEIIPWATKNAICFMQACTDWIGPYGVKSLEYDDGGSFAFTGGWHGNNIDGKQEPTAKTENVTVKVDGKELLDNEVYEGRSLEITATNYVQAYNTKELKRNVLREVVKYNITPNKVNVEVISTALEKVLLQKYYGLQAQNSSFKRIEYSNGNWAKCQGDSDSGPYDKNNIADSFTLISKNDLYKLVVSLETGFGLGDFENLLDSNPTIFTQEYGKTYFNLVNGIDKKVEKGDSITWKGSYEFR